MQLVPYTLPFLATTVRTSVMLTGKLHQVHAFVLPNLISFTTVSAKRNWCLPSSPRSLRFRNNRNNRNISPPAQRSTIANMSSTTSNDTGGEATSSTGSPPLPLRKLSEYANAYAAANGLQVETKRSDPSSSSSSSNASYVCAPISLLPNAFPSESFQTATMLSSSFNLLVDRIARDGLFLQETLGGDGGVASRDDFTRILLQMYHEIYTEEGADKGEGQFAQTADRLGVLRSDYMLHRDDDESGDNKDSDTHSLYGLKQVELNTIASSFAGLAVNVAGLHSLLTQRFQNELQPWINAARETVMGEGYTAQPGQMQGVPPNPALDRLPAAMDIAHRSYTARFEHTDATQQPVILFVVQDGETNTVDQRMLEFNLWQNHAVSVVRLSLTRADTHLRLDETNGALYVLPPDIDLSDATDADWNEVSVVYFRAGYAPTDYPDGEGGIEWNSRRTIERSRATKCPNLGYHLAGTKKVQQALARPGVLNRFFPGDSNDDDSVERLRGAFAGLYSLGDDATSEDLHAVTDALSGGEGRYVLKPQREGGGYNYYGDRLAAKLTEGTIRLDDDEEKNDEGSGIKVALKEDLAEFILMQRLFPPEQKAVLLRKGKVEGMGDSISELGVFGTIVASHDGKTLHNEYSGFLLRTKFSDVDEGGVASGFATLSSPYLC